MFWNKICGFTAIFFICPLFLSAQAGSYIKLPVSEYTQKLFRMPAYKNKIHEPARLNRSPIVIAPNYYAQRLGIICKKEWALEKATKIPFRFRIGSLQQCNFLEGKK